MGRRVRGGAQNRDRFPASSRLFHMATACEGLRVQAAQRLLYRTWLAFTGTESTVHMRDVSAAPRGLSGRVTAAVALEGGGLPDPQGGTLSQAERQWVPRRK